MTAIASTTCHAVFARPDLWNALTFFHGGEGRFWIVTTSGAFFRLRADGIDRVDAPITAPAGMTLEAVAWDAERTRVRGVAVGPSTNQVALLAAGEAALVTDGPALMKERWRKVVFTVGGVVLVTWKESPGAWDAFRFDDATRGWVSLGATVAFPRCRALLVAEERTAPGRLLVLEQRSGAIAVYDGHAWAPHEVAQIGVRALLTDPRTGHIIAFDNDAANAAWRLDGDAWTELPYQVIGAPIVRSFGVGPEAQAGAGDEILFRLGHLEGTAQTTGLVWNATTNVMSSWGVRHLGSTTGLHLEGDHAVFTDDDDDGNPHDVPPYIRITDGALFETRAAAALPPGTEDEDDDIIGSFVTEARTGARIAAHEVGLVTIDAAGVRKRTKHAVEFVRIVALPDGGVVLGGAERAGTRALRFAYFDGTALYDLPIDPDAPPAGKGPPGIMDLAVDPPTGHVLAGFGAEAPGTGVWSVYLGAGRWQPVAAASVSTDAEAVAWDAARRQLLTPHAVIDGTRWEGVFAVPFGALLDGLPPPAANRFDVTTKPTVLCRAPKATKGKATKAPPPLRLAKGLVLSYEMADQDVSDTYAFTIRGAGDDLKVSYAPASKKTTLGFTAAALASARRVIAISQHDHELGREKPTSIAKALPPFLVSTKVLREMRKGATTLTCEGAGDVTVSVKPARRQLPRKGVSVAVDVLHGTHADLQIWVLDDDAFPLVLRRVEGATDWKLLDIEG